MIRTRTHWQSGFTLIELSIVLVIIGLIVGGVLVGQDLIRAAGARAQVTQIEKYNTAANTFRDKYGYLPGDIIPSAASQFGLVARLGGTGSGDGNGIIEGYYYSTSTVYDWNQDGETILFWVDLSTAHLIDGSFTTATGTSEPATSTLTSKPSISSYLPEAKVGNGNYVYLYSNGNPANGTRTYYGLSAVSQIAAGHEVSTPGLTVAQAYSIDKKMDDGLPQGGSVIAAYIPNGTQALWASTLVPASLTYTSSTAGSATSCYDNGSTTGQPQQYSLTQNGGANVTCALSFKLQAGD